MGSSAHKKAALGRDGGACLTSNVVKVEVGSEADAFFLVEARGREQRIHLAHVVGLAGDFQRLPGPGQDVFFKQRQQIPLALDFREQIDDVGQRSLCAEFLSVRFQQHGFDGQTRTEGQGDARAAGSGPREFIQDEQYRRRGHVAVAGKDFAGRLDLLRR